MTTMTTTRVYHIDPASYTGKPWVKVDCPGNNFVRKAHTKAIVNLRGIEDQFTTDNAGFQVLHSPAKEKVFSDDGAVRVGYYAEVEQLLRDNLPEVRKVVIFDHTVRRQKKDAPRQPVQEVHVDQTPAAAVARVHRHLPEDEVVSLLASRFQIINVWRPIENPASHLPLAVVDWRTTSPNDFIPTDLLYPTRGPADDGDDRGKERLPEDGDHSSTTGYEVKGETLAVAPSDGHVFYYQKDMTPDEVFLLKCYDSHGQGMPGGREELAVRTPHTAFIDPQTPQDAPGRQSIEVRCLVFYA